MLHRFPYPEFPPLEIPEENLSGIYCMPEIEEAGPADLLIRRALEAPIGSARLREHIRPVMKIAIAVDDYTRSTRTDLMLPAVLDELAAAGIPREDITVVIATGTHRRMTDEEIREKYTPEVASAYRVVNPDWRNPLEFHDMGIPDRVIRIHRDIVEADFVIGIGQTIAHLIAGFGGGGKIINPGCSDGDTIGEMHYLCDQVPDGQLFSVRDNAVRRMIDDVALRAGLKFIINEVPSHSGLAGVFAGDPIEAHRAACACAMNSCRVRLREKADIVVADAWPSDVDYWQAAKGVNAALGAARDGGTVIVVSPCPEGTCAQHPELTAIGYRPVEETREMVRLGKLDKCIGGHMILGRRIIERFQVIFVSKGISEKDTRAMGFGWAPDPAAALALALQRHGPLARINVLYKASKMICTV